MRALLLGLLLACTACGRDADVRSPGLPAAPGAPTPSTSTVLFGAVSDTAFRPLSGARVEIVDGPQAGSFTTSAADGRFSITFTSSDTVTVRATKDGYASATMNVRPPSGIFLSFYLSPPAQVNIAGTYTLTFVADSACAGLPEALRTRTYTAAIAPSPYRPGDTLFEVTLSGAPFIGTYNGFEVGVAGNYLAFTIYNNFDEGEGVVEEIGPSTYLEVVGTASASVGSDGVSAISIPFSGNFGLCVGSAPYSAGSLYRCYLRAPVSLAECRSQNHRLILTPR